MKTLFCILIAGCLGYVGRLFWENPEAFADLTLEDVLEARNAPDSDWYPNDPDWRNKPRPLSRAQEGSR